MNKTFLIIIVIVVVAVILFMSFRKPSASSGFTGSLVSASPTAGKTNAYYSINENTTQQSYWLTYTPEGFVMGKEIPTTGLPVSKEISASAYKSFITKYPTGLADGNVLSQYN